MSEWVNKLSYIQTMEYYSAIKRDRPIDTCKSLGGFQVYFAEWKKKAKGLKKSHSVCYITFSTWQNYRVGEQINSCQELEMMGGKGVGVAIKEQ